MSSKAPFDEKGDYPEDWPAILALGEYCYEIEGTYSAEGVVFDPSYQDDQNSIQLPGILLNRLKGVEANTVSLRVRTHPKNRFLACLEIVLDEDEERSYQIDNCVCMNERLSYGDAYGGGIPPAIIAGGGEIVWLTKASDGSLIAKIWNHHFGLVVVVPYNSKKYVWARFTPIKE